MASADLRKELECSVCLNNYTDPVTLKCGHNFCRDCIGRVLDTQEASGGYSCPECREELQERPALQRNITLPNIVGNFQFAQLYLEYSGVFSTYGIHTLVPAVKSCLQVHTKSPAHVFCDPTTSLENRKCSVHKKLLEYYCTDDSTFICAYCSEEHLGHQMETLDEASEMKKGQLRNVLQKLISEREETEKRVQSLQERRRKVQGKADDETKRLTVLFRDLRTHLEHLEKRVLSEISGKAERVFLSLSNMIQGLQMKKGQLRNVLEMKKGQMSNVLQKLMKRKEETEKRVQSLQEHRRKVQGKANDETKRLTVLFRDLGRRLEDLEKRVQSEISGQAERVSLSLSEMIQQLEIKKEELTRKMGDIEKLCNMTDLLTVLQESDTGDLCDTEDGDDRERHDRLLHDGGDLDVVGISHTLHTGLSDIMSWVNVHKYAGTRVYPHSTTKGKAYINAGQSKRRPRPYPTIQPTHRQAEGPNIGGVQQTLGVSDVTDILLDVSTAGNSVHLSDDRKTASWSSHQHHPEQPERFNFPQVISSQSFSSGRYYWEVDAGGSLYWRVGMCYPSIDRKGDESEIGCNKKSWGLRRFDNRYSVIHDWKVIRLKGNVSSNRVRIYLNYEAGLISFYELCDPMRHLHTFTATFTEPLHAGVRVGLGACIKISGGNQM